MFFKKAETAKVIANFLRQSERGSTEDSVMAARISLVQDVVGRMHDRPEEWDEYCGFNIEFIGDHFIDCLRNFDWRDAKGADDIYVMIYRFVCEFDFMLPPALLHKSWSELVR